MSLETEVANLTVQTTNLLSAVNVAKSTLDNSVVQAVAASNQVGNVAVVVAAGNITLVKTDPTYQFINPNGANRNVTLPAVTALERVFFVIKNTGTAAFGLTVKNASAVQVGVPIANGYTLTVVWSGISWEVL